MGGWTGLRGSRRSLDDVGLAFNVPTSRFHSRVLGLDFMKPLLYTLILGSGYAVDLMEYKKSCATIKEEERAWNRGGGYTGPPTTSPRCGSRACRERV